MYLPEPDDVYRAARAYLPYLPEDLHSALEKLLVLADAGQKVDNHIIDLMSGNKRARGWMRAALFPENTRILSKDYSPLGGNPKPISARDWMCRTCGFVWYLYRAGQPVPPCPSDGNILVPVNSKQKKARGGS